MQILPLPWECWSSRLPKPTTSSIQMCSPLYSQAQTLSQQHEKLLCCKGTGKWVGRRKGNVGENKTNLLSPLPCLWKRGSQNAQTQKPRSLLKKPAGYTLRYLPASLYRVQLALNASSWFQVTARGNSTIKFLIATQTITLVFSSMWGHHTPSGKLRGMIPLQASSERAWQWCIMRLVVTSFQNS